MFGRMARGLVLGAAILVVLGCGAQLPSGLPGPGLTVPPQAIVDCLAVPAERCAAAVAQAQAEAPPGSAPIRIRMTCSQPACTLVGGGAQVQAWFSDGSVTSWDTEWSGVFEIPPEPVPEDAILPVTPVCVGVDLARCHEVAKDIGVPDGQTGRVTSLVVTCTVAVCGPTDGQGTTTVTFEDGTTQETDWAYAGG